MKRFVFLLMILATGCYYDNEEDLYGTTDCTPNPNPSFSADVLPILDAKCNNCHSGSSPSAGIRLDTYTEVIKYVNNGKFMGSIKHASGYSPMPKGGGKLPACQIQLIQDWVNEGVLNN